jgi:LPS export ABC transporter protein LptC
VGKEMFSVRNQNENYLEYPKGVKLSFFDKNKKAVSWLEADKAVNDLNSRKFIVKGNVRLYNKANDKLQTAELIWDEQAESLYTNKFIKITQPSRGDTLYGYGFKSNSAFSEFEIKKKFSGKVVEGMLNDFN